MDQKDYDEYLKTTGWRSRRNAALRRALWKCERCPAKRGLQVHHKTYERLGAELDADLEVLCAMCHRGTHLDEMHDHDSGRVYLRIASAALARDPMAQVADIAADVKAECARLKLPYQAHQADKAINVLTGANRFKRGLPRTSEEFQAREGRPLSHEESKEILCRLGVM